MRCVAPILLLPLSACVSVVEFVERFDDGTVKAKGQLVGEAQEGVWTYYWPNGRAKAKGRYERDTQVGPWTWWYENGNKRTEGSFQDEHSVGGWRHWHANGRLRMTGWMDKGRKTGEWSVFASNGDLMERGQYVDGKRTSLWTFYRAGGRKKAEGWFLNDAVVGPWKFWNAAGVQREKKSPVPDGFQLVCEYWDNGKLRRAGFLCEEVPVGRWLTWHDTGTRRLSGDFAAGEPTGSWRAFHPNGELLATGPVANGRPRGVWRMREGDAWRTLLVDDDGRPPEVWSGVWSKAEEFVASAGLPAVERWLVEAASPSDAADLVRMDRVDPEPAAVAKNIVVEREEPSPPPIRTQREKKGISAWLKAYTDAITTDAFDFYTSQQGASKTRRDRTASRGLKGRKLPAMKLMSPDGQTVDLGSANGGWRLVVVLRGFAGQVCPYCPVQLKALAPFRTDFEKLGVRVVAVYPGPKSGVRRFLGAYKDTFGRDETPPYAILYDVDSRLARHLEILDGSIDSPVLARPTTLLVDDNGEIRYAYVGKHRADRPAARSLLEKIRELRKG